MLNKLTFNDFEKLIRESLILEDKTRLISKLALPDISDEDEKEKYKALLIDFFKTHSNYENKIDWNKVLTLTKKDFDKVIDSAETSKSNIKRQEKDEIATDIKNIFKSEGDKRFKVVGENNNWLFVSPLSYEAAKFCDSSINQGAGAKWCIGYEQTDLYWNNYTEDGSAFIMAFNKNYKNLPGADKQSKMKFMIQLNKSNKIHIWNQPGDDIGSDVTRFEIDLDQANQMFNSVRNDFAIVKRDVYKKKYGEQIKVGENSFVYCRKDGVLTKYIGDATDIAIPKGVTSIGDCAFTYCGDLTSVTMPEGVKSIEHDAFRDCYSLTSVTIPSSVTSIGDNAFILCSGLTSVTIPDSVASIGYGAFFDCSSLKSVVIPEGVMSISDYTFHGCSNLTSVTIPSSVKSIGFGAFCRCDGLTSVTIPDGVTSVGEWVFKFCRDLTSVTIPASVTSIGDDAFKKCEKLSKLKAPWSLIKKYADKFKDCPVYDEIKARLKEEYD